MNNQLKSVKSTVTEVAIGDLVPHPDNPRAVFKGDGAFESLLRSIAEQGVTNTPIVRHKKGGIHYEIISGHRRIAACRELGYMSVLVDVRDLDKKQALFILMTENMNREDLNPIEEAHGWKLLCDKLKMTTADIADAMGVKEKTVKMRQDLLQLPDATQHKIAERLMGIGVAQLLLDLPAELREEGCELMDDQIELEFSPSVPQAKDLLLHNVIEPHRRKEEWESKKDDRLAMYYTEATQKAKIGQGLDDPLIRYGEYDAVITSNMREALSAISVHERTEDVEAGTLWLHLAQRHNVPMVILPYGQSRILMVDYDVLYTAEEAISTAIKSGEEMLRRDNLGDSMRRDAERLIAQKCWLKIGRGGVTPPLPSHEEDEYVEPDSEEESEEEAETQWSLALPSLKEYLVDHIQKELTPLHVSSPIRNILGLEGKEWL